MRHAESPGIGLEWRAAWRQRSFPNRPGGAAPRPMFYSTRRRFGDLRYFPPRFIADPTKSMRRVPGSPRRPDR
ncbi:hypothetical protein BSLA_02r1210 [Burkholderia stabilis]|nr:hypothetical protein BSLA_02r1210 [Burkholderia stabilis]